MTLILIFKKKRNFLKLSARLKGSFHATSLIPNYNSSVLGAVKLTPQHVTVHSTSSKAKF